MVWSGRKKKIVFGLAALVFVLCVLELIAWIGLAVFDHINGLEVVTFPRGRSAYDKVLQAGYNRYDRDLGWDESTIIRGDKGIIKGRRYFASAYGDSFTWGAEVHEELVWTHRFKQLSGREMLNMGINAAGTDQAFWKIVKHYRTYPTQYVILALLPENISRLVSVVRRFYFKNDPFPYVKPRYAVAADGSVKLLANPISSESGLYRMGSRSFLQGISANDFWYHYHKERHGFDLIHGRRFPAVLGVYRIVRGLIKDGWCPVGYKYFFDTPDSDPMKILKHIVRQLKSTAKTLGFVPLLLVHAEPPNIQDRQFIEPFLHFVRSEVGIEVINMLQVFNREVQAKRVRIEDLYGQRHLSPLGNEMVAQELVRFFQQRGSLTERERPERD